MCPQAARDQLLAVGGDDPAEVHSALSKLSILGRLTTEELAQRAVVLFKRAPPAKLLRHRDLELRWWAPSPSMNEWCPHQSSHSASASVCADFAATPHVTAHDISICARLLNPLESFLKL